ncbi:MAG: hypothetical protein ACKO0Y_04955, partial [Bacteroidota bacterium]
MKYSKLPALSLTVIVALSILTVQLQAQINPITFEEFTMKNGLHVILHKDVSAPNVAVLVQYRVGARDEDPKRTGF